MGAYENADGLGNNEVGIRCGNKEAGTGCGSNGGRGPGIVQGTVLRIG